MRHLPSDTRVTGTIYCYIDKEHMSLVLPLVRWLSFAWQTYTQCFHYYIAFTNGSICVINIILLMNYQYAFNFPQHWMVSCTGIYFRKRLSVHYCDYPLFLPVVPKYGDNLALNYLVIVRHMSGHHSKLRSAVIVSHTSGNFIKSLIMKTLGSTCIRHWSDEPMGIYFISSRAIWWKMLIVFVLDIILWISTCQINNLERIEWSKYQIYTHNHFAVISIDKENSHFITDMNIQID